MNRRHEMARRLRAQGLSIFPALPGRKQPAVSWKPFQSRHPAPEEIDRWFGGQADYNIAVVTGAISGVVVVDVDSAAGLAWAGDNLTPTPRKTRTPKGQHWYYRHPGYSVRNKAGIIAATRGATFDVRGDGGYVLAPGSVHPSGAEYVELEPWLQTTDALPVFDSAWLPLGEGSASEAPPVRTVPDLDERFERARAYMTGVPPAVQGRGGDEHTYVQACRVVRGFDLPDEQALEVLMEWNHTCEPPWSRAGLEEKIRNARRYGREPIGALVADGADIPVGAAVSSNQEEVQ